MIVSADHDLQTNLLIQYLNRRSLSQQLVIDSESDHLNNFCKSMLLEFLGPWNSSSCGGLPNSFLWGQYFPPYSLYFCFGKIKTIKTIKKSKSLVSLLSHLCIWYLLSLLFLIYCGICTKQEIELLPCDLTPCHLC